MPLTRILLLLGALLAANGSALAATPGEQLKAFLSGLRTLESEFQQTLFDENLKLLEESRGLFFLQRPRRFRWDYRVPQAQLIVADGEKVWIYDRELLRDLQSVRPKRPGLGRAQISGQGPERFLHQGRF
jgi:outer membrane lipoprotein carrier protein